MSSSVVAFVRLAVLAVVLVSLPCVLGARYLPADHPFYTEVHNAPLHPNSANMINFLASLNGGDFMPDRFQADFSMHVLHVNEGTQWVEIDKTGGFYSPDCDGIDTFPLPQGGAIEGQEGYQCSGADCHLLVIDEENNKIYEAYTANYNTASGKLETMCAVEWCSSFNYYPGGIGKYCTSTDAAGYPIIPLLFTADEIAAGEIDHALRLVLPNPWFGVGFVEPATHMTITHGGQEHTDDPNAVVYGVRLRLKSNFDDSSYNNAAKVVIAALKKYGIFLADGGNIPLIAASDKFTTAKYANLQYNQHTLNNIKITDFEVVNYLGDVVVQNDDCERRTDLPEGECPNNQNDSGGTSDAIRSTQSFLSFF